MGVILKHLKTFGCIVCVLYREHTLSAKVTLHMCTSAPRMSSKAMWKSRFFSSSPVTHTPGSVIKHRVCLNPTPPNLWQVQFLSMPDSPRQLSLTCLLLYQALMIYIAYGILDWVEYCMCDHYFKSMCALMWEIF